ncbi:endoribonuclease Dcr-2 [Phlebotomus argentipes]|uniref:endoribonuclease Dcr-2 n=1 Tax=Phlebotomus argentipes TaxID=94469 RepID=UPI0028931240|nr:endoribonuclease Dcr-2 [Phlebotomus argentipes]XP_059607609.1 endoribonuclease Dcr-2 [Phlebotomus argentipes]
MEQQAETETKLTPRPYQDQLISVCMEKNTIIYLPTGAGKTFIPLMVFTRKSKDFHRSMANGGKRGVFLASTKVLARQQKEYFEQNTQFKVAVFTGDMNVDVWGQQRWRNEFENNNIVVATYQIVLDVIRHGFLKLENINVIVFDECHNAQGEHPIVELMKQFVDVPVHKQPRVIGLTGMLLPSSRVETLSTDLEALEKCMRSTVATVATIEDYENVLVFATNPVEQMVTYFIQSPDDDKLSRIECLVNKFCTEIDHFKLDHEVKKMSEMDGEKQSTKKKLKQLWQDFNYQMKDLGLYGASLAILGLIVEFDLKKRSSVTHSKRSLYRASIKNAELVRHILVQMMGEQDCPTHEFIMRHASDKLKTLLQSIQSILCNASSEQKLCGLVFVQRRSSAKCIFHILRNYAESKEDFAIAPDFLVGDNSFMQAELEVLLQNNWDRQVLKKFKKNEVNLIVSTAVLEEGVDLRNCNFVINYDMPHTFRAYVQRKGRARSASSIHLLMMEQSEKPKLLGQINKYHIIDAAMKRLLIGKCVDRDLPSAEEIDNDMRGDLKVFTTPKGAKLTDTSAIALLNRYCTTLPQDGFTVAAPDLQCEELMIKGVKKYRISLTLPSQSPVKDEIYSNVLMSKKHAKRSVAFKACIALYEKGELGENLLPISPTMILTNLQSVYFPHWQKYKTGNNKEDGTKKKKRYCDINYPVQLSKCQPEEGKSCFLYIIHTVSDLNEKSGSKVDTNVAVFNKLFRQDRNYAILTTKPLPPLAAMNFFLTDGRVMVKIDQRPVENVVLTEEDLNCLRKFHIVVFRDVLNTMKTKTFLAMDFTNTNNSILIVPMIGRRIDMDLVKKFQEMPAVKKTTENERQQQRFEPKDWLHSVISPWYRSDGNQRYVVTKVEKHLTPESAFPNTMKASTYAAYYENEYDLYVVNDQQFLIEVKGITNDLMLLNPGMSDRGSKKQVKRSMKEILVPELCHNFGFPASMWLKALVLPNVLYRMRFMLHADNIRKTIDRYLGVESATELDALFVDEHKLKVPKETPTSRSIFGPVDDVVVQVENKAGDTLADILDNIFTDHRPPMDVHRNWDKLHQVDLEYYFYFMSLNDEYERANTRGRTMAALQGVSSGMEQFAICATPYEEAFNIALLKMEHSGTVGPQQRDVLCAITASVAQEVFDMERYEVLGDAFLKFTTSLYLLQKHTEWHEGYLTTCKGQIVGNRNLYYCGADCGIAGVINVSPFSVSDFIVPHMNVPQEIVQTVEELQITPNAIFKVLCSDWEVMNGRMDLANLGTLLETFSREQKAIADEDYSTKVFLGKHRISDKTVSDAIEAILGVWVATIGIQKSFKLLNFFHILPRDLDMENLLRNQQIEPKLSPNITAEDIDSHLINPHDFQQRLGYQFRDRAYLLQALTHPSYPANRATGCYQKLEFLGDAVLDIIITSYIFEKCRDLDPGKMTDLRSALVNNITLACVCVRNNFHLHMLHQSPALQEKAKEFAEYQRLNQYKVTEHVLRIKEEDGTIMADSVDVPKTLGDIVEALLGAVFLDSGNDMQAVWRVIVHLMGQEILQFAANVPINAVRKLYEWSGAAPQFSEPSVNPEKDTISVSVKFVCGQKWMEAHGFGVNRKNAKRAAANAALEQLEKNQRNG